MEKLDSKHHCTSAMPIFFASLGAKSIVVVRDSLYSKDVRLSEKFESRLNRPLLGRRSIILKYLAGHVV